MELIDLFIGSEGTLGIVTEIEVGLVPALRETFDLVAFFPTEEQAVDFVQESKRQEDRAINFYEFFDENTLRMLSPSYPLIPTNSKAAIYIEQEIVDANDKAYMDYWAALLEKYGASLETCWLGASSKQKEGLAKFRYSIPEHINEIFKQHHQIKLATDIAVPESKFREMFDFYNRSLAPSTESLFFIKFGHIGDNHLHVNLVAKKAEHFGLAQDLVGQFVRKAVALGGTVSAEHGIGKIKHAYLREMYGPAGIAEMVRVKKGFDPHFLLGRGNIFAAETP
jgi:D-lactate dehydrogenase (cytochrome)